MAQFRHGAQIVDAVRFQHAEYAENPLTFDETPAWLQQALDAKTLYPKFGGEDYWYLILPTADGPMVAGPGDWVVRSESGELTICLAGTFAGAYQPA